MNFAVRQPFVKILGIYRRDYRVSAAGNDLDGRMYLRQNVSGTSARSDRPARNGSAPANRSPSRKPRWSLMTGM